RDGAVPDPRLRDPSSLAAGRRLGRRRAAQHGAAGDRARVAADRIYRAAHARQHDRSAQEQFHPHRESAGSFDDRDTAQARVEARAAPRHLVSRARDGRGDHGLGRHRADLRRARHRPLLRAGRVEPRLHARDGRRRLLRHADHRVQLPRRPRVRVARPEGEVLMTIEVAAHTPVPEQVEGRSLWIDAWRTLRKNRAAIVAAAILLSMTLLVLVGPFFSPYAYDFTDWGNTSIGPSLST